MQTTRGKTLASWPWLRPSRLWRRGRFGRWRRRHSRRAASTGGILRRGERDFLIDLAMLALAVAMAAAVPSAHRVDDPVWAAGFALTTLALLGFRGLYVARLTSRFLDDARGVIAAVAVAALIVSFARSLLGDGSEAAAEAVRLAVFSSVYLVAARGAVRLAEQRMRRFGMAERPTLIVGAGEIGQLVARRLRDRPELGLRPVGFIDSDPLPLGDQTGPPLLGPLQELERLVKEKRVEHAVLSFSMSEHEEELRLTRRLQDLRVSVSVIPRLFEAMPDRLSLERIAGLPLLTVHTSNPRSWQFAVKYVFDRTVAFALIVVLSPLLAACALGVLGTSGRPVLFRQRRVGLDGREFWMLKFRTMRTAEDREVGGKIVRGASERPLGPGGVEGEERRSRFGRWLRRTSLDELPQLVNVLRGEMSLIGPRPERPEYVQLFSAEVRRYADRHRVKAGITGWAQVHGLRGQTSLSDRIEWDNYYIENWSLWLDLQIAILTVVAVFTHRAE